MSWLKRNIFEALDVLKFIGIFLLVLMFIHFNSAIARQTQETQAIAASTNRVVKSQDDILQAIKRATEDNKLTSEQKLNITICMLKVPQSQRTTDVEHNCRSQATSALGTANAAAPQSPSKVSVSSPSSNSTPAQTKQSTNNSQSSTPPTLSERANAILKKLNPFN